LEESPLAFVAAVVVGARHGTAIVSYWSTRCPQVTLKRNLMLATQSAARESRG
jgi:hypothetical protein